MTRVHAFGDDALGTDDAVAIARRIAIKEVSAREIAEAAIARALHVNQDINALELETFAQARFRADNQMWGPLAGVPAVFKDNIDLAGLPTRHGSRAVNPKPAKRDSEVARQFLSTGINYIGKSRLPEFGLNASTEFERELPTKNPWNLKYSAGASSGGSAALVAAGVVPIGHANDGGGSIRIPAAACGLVGLKPTRGRLVLGKLSNKIPIDIIVDGVVTRSVRDTAHFYSGAEQTYRTELPYIGLVEGPSNRKLKIAMSVGSIKSITPDEDTKKAVENTARVLEDLGHQVETIPMPIADAFADDFTLYWSYLGYMTDHFGATSFGRGFDRSKLEVLAKGLSKHFSKNMHKFPGALRRLKSVETTYRNLFRGIDLLLTPTVGHTTPELGFLSPAIGYETLMDRLHDYASYTPLNNVAGGPAITLPLGLNSQEMPVGVHFSANHGDERTLLEIGFALEEAIGFPTIY